MRKIFGTDGVRGKYGKDITDELAKLLGYYGTKVLTESHKPQIIIARDTRESGRALEKALVEGITMAGGEPLLADVIPTPAVPVLIKELGADAGIVISASHNVYTDNGIKFFNDKGFKLPDKTEEEISKLVIEDKDNIKEATLENVSPVHIDNAGEIYLDFIDNIEAHQDLDGLKIVIDCSNGALSAIAPEYFKRKGADIVVVANEPNGKNINKDCGSTHINNLQNKVLETNADFGFSFDGDADRCLAVDNEGQVIDGDKILNLLSKKMKSEGNLPHNTVVITTMSNLGLTKAFEENDIDYIRTDVGDRYVLEEMLENGYLLGGEQSGHIIKLDSNTTGDGLLTAALLADIFKESSRDTHYLNNLMRTYPQILINANVPKEKKYDYLSDPVIQKKINEITEFFDSNGRVVIRPSGTEDFVRVMIEGPNQDIIEKEAQDMVSTIEERLN